MKADCLRHLYILLLVVSATMLAQPVHLPLDSNHYWKQYDMNWSAGNPQASSYYQLGRQKDTIINGSTYHKLGLFGNLINSPLGGFVSVREAYLREDTLAEKVFFYHFGTARDYMLYDFSKQSGDTIKNLARSVSNNQSVQTISLVVSNTSTVLLGDGKSHRKFSFGNMLEVIEGVGSSYGLLTPYLVDENTFTNLVCHGGIDPRNTIYTNPFMSDDCAFTTALPENTANEAFFSVFPNPAAGKLYIKSEVPASFTAVITDILGRLVHTERFSSPDEISVIGLPVSAGTYFITLKDESNRMWRQKISVTGQE